MPAPLDLLLIEDSEAHAELVRRSLRAGPDTFDIRIADCLEAAREAMAQKLPDLIIADLRLPDGSALDLLPGSIEQVSWPMVVLTGEGDESQAVACIKAGAMDYLVKSNEALQSLPGRLHRTLREWGHIVDSRSMQEQLYASEERFRRLFDLSPVGAALLDQDFRFVRCNQALLRFLGYAASELVGQSICDHSYPEDRDVGLAELAQIKQGFIESARYEKRYLRKDGLVIWGQITTRLMSEDRGKHRFFTHVIQDISDTKRYEEALEESNKRLHALFDDANDAIILADPETGVLIDMNHAAERLLGRSRAEILGHQHWELHPNDLTEAAKKAFHEAATQKGKTIVESEVVSCHRGRVHVEISASIIAQPKGKTVYMGILRDLTDRRLLEAQLRQAQKMEAIGQLAGGVAHDFNNVLAAIMLQLGMLQADKRVPSELGSSLALLDASTKRAAELTRQLLLFGRRQPAKLQPIDLDVLLVNLLKMLRSLIGEAIHLDFTPRPGEHWVQGDLGMIEQVVMNLVVNARDAMPQGGIIAISISTIEAQVPAAWSGKPGESSPASYHCLSVSDTGCGMDDTTLKKLFEPFYTTKEQGKGTGLGLATAYGIIKQHQGWIEVESQLGKGSRVRVFLPCHRVPQALPDGSFPTPTIEWGNETILLVEDDAIVRTFTGLSLRAVGYSVVEACDAREALEIWEKEGQRINILLSDMVMPNALSGWELGKRLRELRPGLPIVLMSGYSTDLPKLALEPDTSIVFLQKPFDGIRLTQALRTALGAER